MLDFTFIPARELQRNYKKVFAKAKASKKPIIVMANNVPQAAIMTMEQFEELELWKETAEILSIPGAKESIEQGLRDIEAGDVIPLEDLDRKVYDRQSRKSGRKANRQTASL